MGQLCWGRSLRLQACFPQQPHPEWHKPTKARQQQCRPAPPRVNERACLPKRALRRRPKQCKQC
eukprot:15222411-Alexandrium_andersonii.AAC.1